MSGKLKEFGLDVEMVKYSGGRYRVQMRVDRLINEQTGKMMRMKQPCIQLEAVYCRAECTRWRLGCPRAMNTYWREIWLRKIQEKDAATISDSEKGRPLACGTSRKSRSVSEPAGCC